MKPVGKVVPSREGNGSRAEHLRCKRAVRTIKNQEVKHDDANWETANNWRNVFYGRCWIVIWVELGGWMMDHVDVTKLADFVADCRIANRDLVVRVLA